MNSHNDDNPAGVPQQGSDARRAPAVPIGESVQRDFLICLEDGRPMKMLRRHLRVVHGLTPSQYRAKWGLPPNYPMVAPAYAEAVGGGAIRMRVRHPARPAGEGGDVVWLRRDARSDGDPETER